MKNPRIKPETQPRQLELALHWSFNLVLQQTVSGTIDDSIRQLQINKINQVKLERDNEKVNAILKTLDANARANINLMPTILEAAESYATLGEISDTLKDVFGVYQEPMF